MSYTPKRCENTRMTQRTRILARLKTGNRSLSAADRIRLTMLANEVGSIRDKPNERPR